MKSRHSGDMPLKHSSSKSYFAMVTFDIVSMSFSPMKGDSPEMLFPTTSYVIWDNVNFRGVGESINMKSKSSASRINKNTKTNT